MEMTLTAFKARLTVGARIRQIWKRGYGDVDNIYVVTKAGSSVVWLRRVDLGLDSYRMTWPKRTEIVFTEKGWIRFSSTGEKLVVYEWVDESPKGA